MSDQPQKSESHGGPAFPRSYSSDGHNGMTLRDWFAGQALTESTRAYGPRVAAEVAYLYADAMIARRAEFAAREVG